MKPQPLQQYLTALGTAVVDFQGNPETIIVNAAADSRKITDQGLFVAIDGSCRDGADFVPQAVAAGGVAVIAERPLAVPAGTAFIQVKNAYHAAGIAAEVLHHYPIKKLRAVGLTGTNGKTTCAFLLRDLFRAWGRKTGLIGTVQYEIGDLTMAADRTTPTPFELQEIISHMVTAGVEWLIMEVSSHALDQKRLGRAELQGGLFTNLTGDHCDYHLNMENYFAAKKILFSDHLQPQAPAVINIDDPWGRKLQTELRNRGPARTLSYSLSKPADYHVDRIEATLRGASFSLHSPGLDPLNLTTPLIGRFNISNLAGTAALAVELGIPAEVIIGTIAAFAGAPGRLEAVSSDQEVQVFVDYAHTDDALSNVLKALRELKPARLSVVFGCGGDRDRSKRPRMGRVAAQLADRVYLTTDNPRTEDPEAIIAEIRTGIPAGTDCRTIASRTHAIQQAIREAAPGDVILIAGKGHEDYQIIGHRQLHFDDREEARKALAMTGLPGPPGASRP